MDFNLTQEQQALLDAAQKFSAEKLAPYAGQWDEQEHFPLDVFKQAASLGFSAIYLPEKSGGAGLGRLDGALLFSALARGCISSAAYLSVHNMVLWALEHYAQDAIKKKWFPKLIAMESLGSYCLTEPNAGSDAASLQTKAEKTADGYVLTGSKNFITAGGVSDIYVVMARTGGPGAGGISAFLVERGAKGLSFGKPEQKMGWRSQPTTSLHMDRVAVPQSHLLGQEGDGFKIAMRALDGGRINIAACSLGGAEAAMNMAASYMHQRKQFGKNLTEFQALQFKIADMASKLDAAKLLTYRAAVAMDQGDPAAPQYCAMAKKFASEAAYAIADEALQIHGGYGYIREYGVERILRDLRVNRILEGSNEIMRMIIARKVLESFAA